MDKSSNKRSPGQSVGEGRVSGSTRRGGRKAPSATQAGVGSALRSVYDEAVEESIPRELLDLLGKLG